MGRGTVDGAEIAHEPSCKHAWQHRLFMMHQWQRESYRHRGHS